MLTQLRGRWSCLTSQKKPGRSNELSGMGSGPSTKTRLLASLAARSRVSRSMGQAGAATCLPKAALSCLALPIRNDAPAALSPHALKGTGLSRLPLPRAGHVTVTRRFATKRQPGRRPARDDGVDWRRSITRCHGSRIRVQVFVVLRITDSCGICSVMQICNTCKCQICCNTKLNF